MIVKNWVQACKELYNWPVITLGRMSSYTRGLVNRSVLIFYRLYKAGQQIPKQGPSLHQTITLNNNLVRYFWFYWFAMVYTWAIFVGTIG